MRRDLSPSSALALDVDRLMRLIHATLAPMAKEADTAKVRPVGGMILMTIADMEPVPIQTLTRRLGRDKAQMTRALQALERKGMIERHRCAQDARVWRVSLTGEGRALVTRFQDLLGEVIASLMTDVRAADREQFAATLRTILCAHRDGFDD